MTLESKAPTGAKQKFHQEEWVSSSIFASFINVTRLLFIHLSPAFFFFLDAFKRIQDLFWINVSWSLQRRDVYNSVSEAAQFSSSSLLFFTHPPPLVLAASGVSPQLWPLASLSNDLIFPSCLPPCHHSLSLPCFPGDREMKDLGGKGSGGVCFFWKPPCLLSFLNISRPFLSKSNLNGGSCSLVTLMCTLGPVGAGYAGRILMAGVRPSHRHLRYRQRRTGKWLAFHSNSGDSECETGSEFQYFVIKSSLLSHSSFNISETCWICLVNVIFFFFRPQYLLLKLQI